jgi:hypothetical protein
MRCISSAASTTIRARESTVALGSLRLAFLAAVHPLVLDRRRLQLSPKSTHFDLTSTSSRSVL